MTTDHTLAEALERHSELPLSERRASQVSHVLTNAVGAGSTDLSAEIRSAILAPGDRLLLCTDGLTAHVHDHEIGQMLTSTESAAETARSLVDLANDRGGTDNVTVLIARF